MNVKADFAMCGRVQNFVRLRFWITSSLAVWVALLAFIPPALAAAEGPAARPLNLLLLTADDMN